jgi:hypothetical protein
LTLIGKYLQRIQLKALVDPAYPVRWGIANSDILKSCLALLCLGKNDFEAIESQRKDRFFARALDLRAAPSAPALRLIKQPAPRERRPPARGEISAVWPGWAAWWRASVLGRCSAQAHQRSANRPTAGAAGAAPSILGIRKNAALAPVPGWRLSLSTAWIRLSRQTGLLPAPRERRRPS